MNRWISPSCAIQPRMDNKTVATIVFRVIGLGYLVFALFYGPFVLFTASYSGTLITSVLGMLTYVAAGLCLFILSKPLASITVKGLDPNVTSPPPPPNFELP